MLVAYLGNFYSHDYIDGLWEIYAIFFISNYVFNRKQLNLKICSNSRVLYSITVMLR